MPLYFAYVCRLLIESTRTAAATDRFKDIIAFRSIAWLGCWVVRGLALVRACGGFGFVGNQRSMICDSNLNRTGEKAIRLGAIRQIVLDLALLLLF